MLARTKVTFTPSSVPEISLAATIASGSDLPKSAGMENERPAARRAPEVIDDLRFDPPMAVTGTGWALVSDRVMGGTSGGSMTREVVGGREAIRMTGGVSLENNGGFLQVALDLGDAGSEVDARRWSGIRLDVFGNNEI